MSDVTILDEATDMTEFWLKTRIAELEAENQRLRAWIQAEKDCSWTDEQEHLQQRDKLLAGEAI